MLFRIKPLRKYYFGLYKHYFKPFNLFRGVTIKAKYDRRYHLSLDVEEWIQQHVFFFGMYDQPGIDFIKKSLNPEDIFFDIGANIGLFSISASGIIDHEKGGQIHAFEPIPQIFEKLTENIARNAINHIKAHPVAIYERSQTLELFIARKQNLGASSIYHSKDLHGEPMKVDAISIDDFMTDHQIPGVDFIKMDIEGAEIFALKGMIQTLKRFKPLLMVEISENVLKGRDIKGNQVFDFLKEQGYVPHALDEEGNISSIPVKSSLQGVTNYVFVHTDNRRIPAQ
jgi:FkbM family methyltransferase